MRRAKRGRHRLGAALIAAAALAAYPVAAARADDLVTTDRAGDVAALAGVVAFSTQHGHSYRLTVVSGGGAPQVVPHVASAKDPFDVDLGRDAGGHVVATYSRCTKVRCRMMQADPVNGGEQTLFALPASAKARRPVRWGSRVVYVRGVRGSSRCDAIAVRTLGAHAATRAYHGVCGKIGDLDLEGTTVAAVSSLDNSEEQTDYTLFTLDARSGRTRVLSGTGEGADTQRYYTAVVIDGGWVTVLRTETVFGELPKTALIIRVRATGTGRSSRSLFAPAGGELAVAGHTYYWTDQNGDLVRIAQDPFGSASRTLLPSVGLTLDGAKQQLSGRVLVRTVRNNTVTATAGVAGVAVQALKDDHAVGAPVTTDPAGRFSVSVADHYDDTALYSVLAATTPPASPVEPVSENGSPIY